MSTYLGPFFVDQPVSFSIERDVINSQSIAEYLVKHRSGLLPLREIQLLTYFFSWLDRFTGRVC